MAWQFPSYGDNWREISDAVKRRDGYRCTDCGATHVTLHAHHIRSLSKGGTNNPTNLKTVCESCHSRYHAHMQGNSHPHMHGNRRLKTYGFLDVILALLGIFNGLSRSSRGRSRTAFHFPKPKAFHIPKPKAFRIPKPKAFRIPKPKAFHIPKRYK